LADGFDAGFGEGGHGCGQWCFDKVLT
jgi:hypothetical protein